MSAAFSVVMPLYNAAAYVHAALRSIANADGRERLEQVVIVDDGSTDGSGERARLALEEFGLPGEVLRLPHNGGACAARAYGFERVRSPLVACVDADDLCTPSRFVDALARLDEDPRLQLVGGDLVMFADPHRPPAHGTLPFSSDHRIRMPVRGEEIAAALVFHCPVYASTSTFRRAALDAVALPQVRLGEDWLLAHRIVQAFGPHAVGNTGTVLMRYRRHAGQLTGNAFLDNSGVLEVWKEILHDALGIDADHAELELHARFSPPSCKPQASAREYECWCAWSDRLRNASESAGYVPAALVKQLDAITAAIAPGAMAPGSARAALA